MQKIRKLKKSLFLLPALTGLFLSVLVLFHVQTVEAATYKAKGIDVSRWQGNIDWEKVKNDGVEFAMLGIGRYRDGVGIPDTMFKHNIENALKQGIKVGVYLYSEALTVEEAQAEAQFVLQQIDGYKISYPIAFDIEDASQRALTNKQRTDITIAFLEIIEAAGYYPMIYASENWLNESMDLTRLTQYDKWVARWASSVSFTPLSMWQYSSTGKVDGISTAVDLDYSYKDYSKIITPRTKAKATIVAGWKTDGTNYWYVNSDGTIPKKKFQTISGNRYYFNAKGYRVYGWKKIGGKYYYFTKKTGVMKKGWQTISGKKYYFDPETGVRLTGWITVDGEKYYMSSKGILQTGWLSYGGNKYFLNLKTGKLRKGWLTLSGNKYFLNLQTGKMRTGWLTYKGKTYFFKTKTGKMCTGWLTYKKKTYYFAKKTGVMQKGWLTLNGKTYYFNEKGERQIKWKKIDGKWYYFGPKTGVMQKNKKLGKYQFDENGVCLNK